MHDTSASWRLGPADLESGDRFGGGPGNLGEQFVAGGRPGLTQLVNAAMDRVEAVRADTVLRPGATSVLAELGERGLRTVCSATAGTNCRPSYPGCRSHRFDR